MTVILIYGVVLLAIFTLIQGVMMVYDSANKTGPASLKRKTMAEDIAPSFVNAVRSFEKLIAMSGIGLSPTMLLIGMAMAVGIVMLGTNLLAGLAPLVSLAAGLAVGGMLPLVYLALLRKRRLFKLTLQLPEALDMLVRSLRVGHPVPIGIEMVATEMPNPIGGEFRRVYDSMSYGLDLKTALEVMNDRLDVPEVRYMVSAIRIQYSTGGNLAEILASLASVMRERVRLKMKVKALTAETRLSGTIMSFMPVAVVGGLYILQPTFYQDVPNAPILQIIMGSAVALLVIGIVLMRRVVNIRV